jgi:predicted transcriptional regulator
VVTPDVTISFDEPSRLALQGGMSKKHPLIKYAKAENKTLGEIAKSAGVSRMALYRAMKGENQTLDMLRKISAATDGKVPVEVLIAEAA